MISMMYLVYTALLALNVSVQILDGYKLINNSMLTSSEIANASKNGLDKAIAKEYDNNPVKFKAAKESFAEVSKKAEEIDKFIADIKHQIIVGVDGPGSDKVDTLSSGGLGELNIPSVIWKQQIADKGETKDGKLFRMMTEYKEICEKAYGKGTKHEDAAAIADLEKTFDMKSTKKDGITHTWESKIFEDMPAIGAMTMLSKVQNDLVNTQVALGKYLIGAADAEDVRVNKMEAVAISNTGYVLRGGKYEAKILLAAFDSTKKPDIYVNGAKLGADGKYAVGCPSVGNKKYTGYIEVKKKDGSSSKYNFVGEYVVGEPTATISPDMLNVVYAGYPNPISVSVPGVAMSDVNVSFTNCAVSKKGDANFVITPHSPGKSCDVTVMAKIGGKPQKMGNKAFRILPLPPPLAFIAGPGGKLFGGGNIKKGALVQSTAVVAKLNSDLLTNVKYTVQKFDMKSFDSMGNSVVLSSNSGEFSGAMRSKMKSLAAGKTFYISGTIAKGPDGKSHKLPAVEVNIQ